MEPTSWLDVVVSLLLLLTAMASAMASCSPPVKAWILTSPAPVTWVFFNSALVPLPTWLTATAPAMALLLVFEVAPPRASAAEPLAASTSASDTARTTSEAGPGAGVVEAWSRLTLATSALVRILAALADALPAPAKAKLGSSLLFWAPAGLAGASVSVSLLTASAVLSST